jgi:hypothetical protein
LSPSDQSDAWYATANREMRGLSGYSLPSPTDGLRQATMVHNPTFGIDHASGAVFYPCCGLDTLQLRRAFGGVCDSIVLKMSHAPAPISTGPLTRHIDDGR